MLRTTKAEREVVMAMRVGMVLVSVAGVLLTGCGAGRLATPVPVAGVSFQGSVHGGQQPVADAVVQLYAAGATGYGSAAQALIGSVVRSDAQGRFSITGAYTCPTANTQVYLTATGGDPGLGSGTNANLAMMAALGACGDLTSASFINVNELTTVGSVWALAPFMTGAANVGTSAANATGLVNAFADVTTLVDIAGGTAPGRGAPAGATMPLATMNTLADILAACVNSAGGLAGSNTACGSLFTATSVGGVAPTDTLGAALSMAQHPGVQVSALYNLSTPTAPFQPVLAVRPADFTLAATFAGGALNKPSALASDAQGNVWVTNAGGNTVTELAHTGAVLSGAGFTAGLNAPSAVAVALDGSVWVTNKGNNTVSHLTSAGAAFPGGPVGGGGLNLPASIAFDAQGTAWVGNGNGSVTTITSGGVLANYATGGTGGLVAVGLDPH